MINLYKWECPECGYSWEEAKTLAMEWQTKCGMCSSDSGHDVIINKTIVPEEQIYAMLDDPELEMYVPAVASLGVTT